MGRSALSVPHETTLTREDYCSWAERQPTGRFERHQGVVVAMAPERAGHALHKAAVRDELLRAVRAAGLHARSSRMA